MRSFAIIPNQTRDKALEVTHRLLDYLSSRGAVLYMDEYYRDKIDRNLSLKVTFLPEAELYTLPCAAITLGGDGTILKAAGKIDGRDMPILGINLGRIGYLAEFEADKLDRLDLILEGKYKIESRIMLDVELKRAGRSVYTGSVLNDAVVSGTNVHKLIEFEVYYGEKRINTYRANGAIAATPTGSTAYSLSAGGPIVDIESDVICLTPICPHSLSTRPIIFSSKATLRIVCAGSGDGVLTLDGEGSIPFLVSDELVIKKSEKTTKLITPGFLTFYDVLRKKICEI